MQTPKRKLTVAQRQARAQRALRILAITGSVPVASVAIWVSYWHMVQLISRYEAGITPYIMPVAVDGMMIVAAVAILARTQVGVAYGAFTVGVVASLAANIASATSHTPTALLVAGAPSVLLVLTAELLLRLTVPAPRKRKRGRRRPVRRPAPASLNGRHNRLTHTH